MAAPVRITHVDDAEACALYNSHLRGLRPEARLKLLKKRDFYFAHLELHWSVVERLLLDEVASYSMTEAELADITSDIIKQQCGHPRSITDLMACVGGNTISFASYFERVVAYELDQTRAKFLWHNLRMFGFVGHGLEKVSVFCGDSLPSRDRSIGVTDVMFLDPPWGGPGYAQARADSLRIEVGEQDLSAIVNTLFEKRCCQYLCLKLPLNFAFTDFFAATEWCGTRIYCEVIRHRNRSKFKLLIIKFR
jgi:hypothetical protein